MSKSGLYIDGKKVCDITDETKIEFAPKSINVQGGSIGEISGGTAVINNSPNSHISNSFNNQGNRGFINQGLHQGDIHIENSKIIVDGKEFLINEYAHQQDVKIEIHGDIESVYTQNGSLNVSANDIENVQTKNGAVNVNANSVGSVKTKNGAINRFD